MSTEQMIGPREAAALLMAALERRDWRFSLEDDEALTVVIGDTPPRLTQQMTLDVIHAMNADIVSLLRDRRVH